MGVGAWVAGIAAANAPIAYGGSAVAMTGMTMAVIGALGMATRPHRVELALRLARELTDEATAGHCATVIGRASEVRDLDFVVYEVVLMEDARVAACFEHSS